MRKVGWIVFGTALVFAACSGSGTTPATAPPTSPGPSSTVATTSTQPPTATSLIEPTTTTVDRIAEIEAILLDLNLRRIRALVDGDESAFRSLFANQGYLDRSLPALDENLFESMPDEVRVEVVELLHDDVDCLAVRRLTYVDGQPSGGGEPSIAAVEPLPSGGWGFSFSGEGWQCDGPHPFGDS